MRACFLGQNVCALGYGVAMVQTLPLDEAALAPPAGLPPEATPASPLGTPENRMIKELRRRLAPVS